MNKELHWKPISCDMAAAEQLRRLLRVPKILAQILVARGLRDPQQARFFLDARLSQLEDPFKLLHIREVAERLHFALKRREDVAVFGDYDVDGISSTALMVHTLRHFEGKVRYYIPRRFEDGYGLSQSVVERAYADGVPKVVLALDCGTNSVAQVQWMRDRGTTVIIVDHHRATCELHADLILVNPNVHGGDDQENYGIFCTAGLVFKCIHGLLKVLRRQNDRRALDFNLKGQLDLVAMATVADVVPLLGENRIFVKYGLKELQSPWRPGTKAIISQAALDGDHAIVASDLSFKVCPRINASGRIANATPPVEMFLTEDPEKAKVIASELAEMNLERQRIESEITEEASRMVETEFSGCNSIVLFNDHWHTGVIGIVAGKLMQRYRKPCVVLSREENNMAKGSGRCVSGLSLVDLFSKCSHLLGTWGGHPLAAGIGMPIDNISHFREAFEVSVTEALRIIDVANDLEIVDWITAGEINESLMRQLRQLEPFGQGNPQPVFGVHCPVFLGEPHIFGNNHQHFNFVLAGNGRSLHGVAWQKVHLLPLQSSCDIAVRLHTTYWNGNRGIQVELVDLRPSASTEP
ncbi:MAG: single-stranded-DNA-specific exonuclease RecJ [Puniceicoccales bacterium]|nr:single-stranded-DNA-specific exonuclease RecJ [Puniceicoccales bacterium]